MELDKLLPVQPEFSSKKTGKTYTIRKIGLRDHAWLIEKHGNEQAASDIFRKVQMVEIAKFIYHLLSQDDRRDFLAFEGDEIDDDGVEVHVIRTGAEVLLDALDDDEKQAMFAAVTRAMIISSPQAEAAVNEALKEEKKRLKQNAKQTGRKSSTKSQASTDTPSMNLGV